MPRRPARLPAALFCLTLAACGTPQERCIASVTRDLRVVDRLIAEGEANLARGYAYVSQTVYVPSWEMCTAPVLVQPTDGSAAVLLPGQMCLDDRPQTIRRAVAIDLDAERRTLDGLRKQRAKLSARAAPLIGQCQATYPG
jgi:hypothetical protein